ncbi:MAG: hypothetical protein ABII97_03235 [Patescibacteria group bacterium]
MKKIDGVWHFEENWFLKYVWGANFLFLFYKIWSWTKLEDFSLFHENNEDPWSKTPKYPKSLCSLVWGSFGGVLSMFSLTPVIFLFRVVVDIFFFLAVFVLVPFLGAFFGYYVDYANKHEFFPHKYKHWKGKRIPVAAWEIVTLIFGLWLLIKLIKVIIPGATKIIVATLIFSSAPGELISSYPLTSLVLATIIAICLLSFFLFGTKTGQLTRDYLSALKGRFCPIVIIEKKE